MKTILTLLILFSLIALPLHADTDETAIETNIAVIKAEIQNLNEKIDTEIRSLNEKIDTEIRNLNEKIDDKFNNLEKRFDSIEKNFDRQSALIIACIAIPMALIALMITWRSIKDNSQEKQIQTLAQEIEMLKQQLP